MRCLYNMPFKELPVQPAYKGAACTTLLAKKYINTKAPLIIANSDQYINWNSSKALYDFNSKNLDGAILTFEAIHLYHNRYPELLDWHDFSSNNLKSPHNYKMN